MFVFTHFEMGDSIICNGLVRNLKQIYNPLTLFCKTSLKQSMLWLYNDIDIKLLFFKSYDEANEFIKKENPTPLLTIGFDYIQNPKILDFYNIKFDEMFYKIGNVPFHKRWDDFYVKRNIDREYCLFKQFNVKEKEYIFVHDQYSNETPFFKTEIINKKFPVIKPDITLTNNIFDYLYLIEHAFEIHCVCSSFKNLIDSMTNISCPLFFHKNRSCFKITKNWISSCKLKWTHIDY